MTDKRGETSNDLEQEEGNKLPHYFDMMADKMRSDAGARGSPYFINSNMKHIDKSSSRAAESHVAGVYFGSCAINLAIDMSY